MTDGTELDDQALTFLAELERRGPLRVRTVLAEYDICESDLHGLVWELRHGDLVVETTVAGERAYDTTASASERLELTR